MKVAPCVYLPETGRRHAIGKFPPSNFDETFDEQMIVSQYDRSKTLGSWSVESKGDDAVSNLWHHDAGFDDV